MTERDSSQGVDNVTSDPEFLKFTALNNYNIQIPEQLSQAIEEWVRLQVGVSFQKEKVPSRCLFGPWKKKW